MGVPLTVEEKSHQSSLQSRWSQYIYSLLSTQNFQ